MANQNSRIDDNHRHTLLGVTDDVAAEFRRLLVDPATGRLKVSAVIASSNIEVFDEGISITPSVSSFDFVGAGVTATAIGNAVTVTIPGVSDIEIGVTDVVGSTVGSVLFVGAGLKLQEDNPNFFWDDTNNILGIGTNTPNAKLEITGTAISPLNTLIVNQLYTASSRNVAEFYIEKSGIFGFVGSNPQNGIRFQSNDAGPEGPILDYYHNSASPANNDHIGGVHFYGNNSVGSVALFGGFQSVASEVTAGSEKGIMIFYASTGLFLVRRMTVENSINGISVGNGAAVGILRSQGNNDLTLQTGNATTGTITITDGANGDIILSPNGTGAVVVNSKLTVTGAIDPTSLALVDAGNAAFISMAQGASAGLSAASTGRIIYNATSQTFQISENGGAYADLSTGGSVTSVSVVTANGLAGTVATPTTTPAITVSTTVTGVLTGNGTAISALSLTAGSVVFSDGTTLTQDNTNFFWDDTNNRLGLGTTTPLEQLHLTGNLRLPATTGATAGVIFVDGNRFIHTFGLNNTFVGEVSGNFTLTGANSTAVGLGAGAVMTTATQVTLVGAGAGGSLTTGSNSTLIGFQAGTLSTTGFNCFLGSFSGNNITTGSNNTFLGLSTAANLLTGSFNVVIGQSAGVSLTGAESDNVIIGGGADASTGVSRSIAVGRGSLVSANSTMALGGTGVDAVSVVIGATSANSTFQVVGSFALPVTTQAGTYTATATDYTILVNNAAAATINLPTAVGITGRMYVIKKISASGGGRTVTIDPSGAETIDGAATEGIGVQFGSRTIVSNGANWFII